MTIEVKGLDQARRRLAKVREFIKNGDKEIMDEAGEEVIKKIITRTSQNKDADGNKFPAYSSAYAKRKRGGPLYESGSLMSSFMKRATKKLARVFLNDNRHWESDISNRRLGQILNDGEGKQKKRKFMGLTTSDTKEILKFLREKITEKVQWLWRHG